MKTPIIHNYLIVVSSNKYCFTNYGITNFKCSFVSVLKMDTSILKEAGLTGSEIQVYVALLQLGPTTTGPIINETKTSRSIIYQILEKLMEKGLVSYTVREKTKYFQAAEPHQLLDVIDKKRKHLEERRVEIEQLVPQLLAMRHPPEQQETRTFVGFKGMMMVHEHTYEALKKGDEYFFLGIPPEQPEHFHSYWEKDHKRRVRAGIRCKLLFHPDTPRATLASRNVHVGCEARYMHIKLNTPAWFMGYENVAVIGFPAANPITVEIISKEIATAFRAYFDEFWKHSKLPKTT